MTRIHTRARLRVALPALALLGILAGCAGQEKDAQEAAAPPRFPSAQTPGCDSPRPAPSPIETAGSTMYSTPTELDAALGVVQRESEGGRFADVFGGVEVVPEKGEAIIYRVPSADFDAYVASVAGQECIHFRDALYSLASLVKLSNRISDDVKYWHGKGVEINMTGPLPDASGVQVGVSKVDGVREKLVARYGAAIPITVVKEDAVLTW
ncbi:hypothetical protein Cs7R123_60660 [Catellatospora sp. TT07R-123]|uniref:hypothetical protein n=1 Tax=Catellatospora sp. TT07R-123 TaxID=2733863 RepID=UPI001B1A7428|nr:hypothetical protein [Catellatospora sp. TT07R-123]GHJ48724.1 hypothetical protein Cs7R123_60660 [Catellatospora sp. TT07R-123]